MGKKKLYVVQSEAVFISCYTHKKAFKEGVLVHMAV